MPRRLLSLLASLLLALSAQAAADGDDDDDDRDDGHDGKDGKRKGKDRGHDRDDDRDPGREVRDGRDDDREDDEGNDGGDEDRRAGKGKRALREREGSPMAPAARDAGLQVLTTALPGRIQFSFLVVATVDEVALSAELPDVKGDWTLSGPGGRSCDLAGLKLDCRFGALAPGEVRLVQVSAPVGRAPPWELVAAGMVSAGDGTDAVPGNDAATGRIGLLLH